MRPDRFGNARRLHLRQGRDGEADWSRAGRGLGAWVPRRGSRRGDGGETIYKHAARARVVAEAQPQLIARVQRFQQHVPERRDRAQGDGPGCLLGRALLSTEDGQKLGETALREAARLDGQQKEAVESARAEGLEVAVPRGMCSMMRRSLCRACAKMFGR